MVGDEADQLYMKGDAVGGLALFDRERAQIEAAWAWLRNTAFQAVRPAGILPAEAEPVQAGSPPGRSGWKPEFLAARQLIALVNAVAYTGQELRFHPRSQRIPWLESQLHAARLVKDRSNEGNALGNLGNAHADLGDARKAIEYHEENIGIAREIGDRRGEGNALGNLGNAHAALGDARKAIEFYEQQLVIVREIGDRRGEGNALGSLGLAHADLGDARKAIEYHEQYLAIAREIGDRRGEGNALWNSAVAHDSLGNRPEAIARAAAALEIFEAIEDPNAAMVRAALAEWRGEQQP